MKKIAPSNTGKSLGVESSIQGPSWDIPQHLLWDFTMGGVLQVVVNWFYGDTGSEDGYLDWIRSEDLHGSWGWCLRQVEKCCTQPFNIYYPSDHFLPEVLTKYSVLNKSVMIVGSATPLYEAFIHKFGGSPITVEYRPIKHNIEVLETYTLDQAVESKLKSDYAMSISSIEHAGLGRYGDLLDPDADIKTMNFIRNSISDNGLFFIQIPVGIDTLVWNAQRIYGRYRLARLFDGWEILEVFGYQKYFLIDRNGYEGVAEPIFVLRKSDDKDRCLKSFESLLM